MLAAVIMTTCNDDIAHSRYVVEVEPFWQLKIQLNGGTLVRALQSIQDHNVNLEEGRRLETSMLYPGSIHHLECCDSRDRQL